MKRKLLLAAASLLAAVTISTISQAQPPPMAKASFKWLSFKGSDGTNYDFPKFGETAEKDENGNPLVALDDAQGELTLEPATWGVE